MTIRPSLLALGAAFKEEGKGTEEKTGKNPYIKADFYVFMTKKKKKKLKTFVSALQ